MKAPTQQTIQNSKTQLSQNYRKHTSQKALSVFFFTGHRESRASDRTAQIRPHRTLSHLPTTCLNLMRPLYLFVCDSLLFFLEWRAGPTRTVTSPRWCPVKMTGGWRGRKWLDFFTGGTHERKLYVNDERERERESVCVCEREREERVYRNGWRLAGELMCQSDKIGWQTETH